MDTPALLSTDSLTIYLNDHLAGATFGTELVQRMVRENTGTDFEQPLRALSDQIQSDLAELESIVDALGKPRDRIKRALGWSVEKVGRLKPNGRLLGYTPLGRLLELEALAAGVAGKRGLWRALGVVSLEDAPPHARLQELIASADGQLAEIERLHALAAEVAFEGVPAHA
jgi:hypothetical protein